MRRRRNRWERPPRVGAVVLAQALAGVFLIFIVTGVGVAAGGYFQIPVPTPVPLPGDQGQQPQTPIPGVEKLPDPKPGGPRTLLILGSDRRSANSTDAKENGQNKQPHSDTIVLVRLDPKKQRIAVLSLPRDLAVTIPGYADNTKINAAYDEGGAAKTLDTVRYLFQQATGKDIPINSVIDVSFNGFQKAVNYVHGVYVDVDQRYYNPEGTGYSAIDIQPGYQRLTGSQALAYVRFRHTDSDIFRNARQQDFLRQAANQPSVTKLKSLGEASRFIGIMENYFRFDKQFLTRKNIAGLLKTAFYLAIKHAPVNQIALQGITEAADPVTDTRLYISNENLAAAYNEFLTGEKSQNPARSTKVKKVKKPAKASKLAGLVNARRNGEDLAVLVGGKAHFPFYFPQYVTTPSHYMTGTPRVYSLRDESGKLHRAYRIVIAAGGIGEYYGVQGMTWKNPPLLANPDLVRNVDGRKLMLFYDGAHLRQVAWRTPKAVYWVTNTVDKKIANTKLIAIASSLTRLKQ
jgi:LCP family protein required for cell wall assembly